MQAILIKKTQLERDGGHPRIVILGDAAFRILEEDWFEALGEAPGGGDMAEELSMRRRIENRASADGMLFDLAVFKVDTLEGFEVY
jgi:hypothetical protein